MIYQFECTYTQPTHSRCQWLYHVDFWRYFWLFPSHLRKCLVDFNMYTHTKYNNNFDKTIEVVCDARHVSLGSVITAQFDRFLMTRERTRERFFRTVFSNLVCKICSESHKPTTFCYQAFSMRPGCSCRAGNTWSSSSPPQCYLICAVTMMLNLLQENQPITRTQVMGASFTYVQKLSVISPCQTVAKSQLPFCYQ